MAPRLEGDDARNGFRVGLVTSVVRMETSHKILQFTVCQQLTVSTALVRMMPPGTSTHRYVLLRLVGFISLQPSRPYHPPWFLFQFGCRWGIAMLQKHTTSPYTEYQGICLSRVRVTHSRRIIQRSTDWTDHDLLTDHHPGPTIAVIT